MPTRLPTGVLVVNLTPHDLLFGVGNAVIVAPSDGVLNALPVNEMVYETTGYQLTNLSFRPMREGIAYIKRLREQYPDALLVGSNIAAQTYREEIVAPVPMLKGQAFQRKRLVRPDLFTTYKKEMNNHG